MWATKSLHMVLGGVNTQNIVFLTFAYIPIVRSMVSLQGCFQTTYSFWPERERGLVKNSTI